MKKKKPSFGFFGTLNPDAGDVEKSIEIFNNSISSGDSSESIGEDVHMTTVNSVHDVFKQFDVIVDTFLPDADAIEKAVSALYSKHKGEKYWDLAWEKWNEGPEDDEFLEMFNFEDEKEDSLLLENKTVSFDGNANPNYGWIVIMAGGPGSGKGFVFDNLVPIHGKKLDVDQLKTYKLRRSEVADDIITFRDGTQINLTDAGINEPYDLSNPKFVELLHNNTKALKKAQRDAVFQGVSGASKDRLPNLIFDITSDKISSIEDIIFTYKPLGYKIALVYVFTDIDVAIEQNALRARKVRYDLLLDKHDKVYKTLVKLLDRVDITNEISDIWVVQQYHVNANDRGELVDYIRDTNVVHLQKSPEGIYQLEEETRDFLDKQLDKISDRIRDLTKSAISKDKPFDETEFGRSV